MRRLWSSARNAAISAEKKIIEWIACSEPVCDWGPDLLLEGGNLGEELLNEAKKAFLVALLDVVRVEVLELVKVEARGGLGAAVEPKPGRVKGLGPRHEDDALHAHPSSLYPSNPTHLPTKTHIPVHFASPPTRCHPLVCQLHPEMEAFFREWMEARCSNHEWMEARCPISQGRRKRSTPVRLSCAYP